MFPCCFGVFRGLDTAQEEIRQLLEDEDFYCCRALASLQELSDELHREMRSSRAEIIALADTSSVGFYAVLSFNACYFFLRVLLHPYNNTHSESVHTGVILGCSQLG